MKSVCEISQIQITTRLMAGGGGWRHDSVGAQSFIGSTSPSARAGLHRILVTEEALNIFLYFSTGWVGRLVSLVAHPRN